MRSCWAFSPSEVQSRLIAVLRDYAQVAKRLESREALYLRPGAEVAWHVAGGESAQPSPTRPMAGRSSPPGRRPRAGASSVFPRRWKTHEHCSDGDRRQARSAQSHGERPALG